MSSRRRYSQCLTLMDAVVLISVIFVKEAYCRREEECDWNNMINCLVSFTDSAERAGLFFPDTQEKLRDYCAHLKKGLDCADKLLDKCATEGEKQVYRNLTDDMYGTNLALCTEGSPLSIRFLKHVGCYMKLSDRFKTCSDRYIGNILVVQGLSPEQHVKMTCCTVSEYSRCMRNVVASRCDREAAELVEDTVVRTLNPSVQYCKQHENVPTRDCRRIFTPISSESSGDELTGESDTASPLTVSFTLITVLLLRLMLFR